MLVVCGASSGKAISLWFIVMMEILQIGNTHSPISGCKFCTWACLCLSESHERSLSMGGHRGSFWGHCLVNWLSVCRPKSSGGLGILDLCILGVALRLCWMWFLRVPEKSWCCLPPPFWLCWTGKFFKVAAKFQIGYGRNSFLWEGKWINDIWIEEIAPNLYSIVSLAVISSRLVAVALQNAGCLVGCWSAGHSQPFTNLYFSPGSGCAWVHLERWYHTGYAWLLVMERDSSGR